MTTARQHSTPNVFARTVPLLVERHYFGEHRQADLTTVETRTDKAYLGLTKRLLALPETTAIRTRDRQFMDYLRRMTTPFRPGMYLVPLGVVEQVEAEARRWEQERAALVEVAQAAYPAQIELMREPLGPNYNPLDYPTPERFAAHYWVDWRFVDFGVPGVLQQIRAEVFEREREKMARVGAQARQMVEQHLAGTLLKITEHVRDVLAPRANGKLPALRDGALDRLFEFLDTAALRDVTNFAALQDATATLRRVTRGLDVEQLREDKELRTRTAAELADVASVIETLVVDDAPRAIRLRDEEGVAI